MLACLFVYVSACQCRFPFSISTFSAIMGKRRVPDLYRAPFPLYTVKIDPTTGLVITGGGGGASKTGIKNALVSVVKKSNNNFSRILVGRINVLLKTISTIKHKTQSSLYGESFIRT